MSDKLTDKEIKKALEWHLNEVNHCDECPLFVLKNTTTYCVDVLMQNSLDLINRLEGENEKNENIIRVADKTIATQKAEIEVSQRRIATLEKLAEHRKRAVFERVERNLKLRKDLETANADNESLKAEIERLKNHTKEGIDLAKQIPEMLALAKAEAYKECLEIVKGLIEKHSVGNGLTQLRDCDIDNLLNELVGEDNFTNIDKQN